MKQPKIQDQTQFATESVLYEKLTSNDGIEEKVKSKQKKNSKKNI